MRVFSNSELQRLSRNELLAIQRTIADELPRLAENSAELRAAHFNHLNIRNALARPEFRPR